MNPTDFATFIGVVSALVVFGLAVQSIMRRIR